MPTPFICLLHSLLRHPLNSPLSLIRTPIDWTAWVVSALVQQSALWSAWSAMAFLFGRNRQRSAQDIVRSSKDLLQKLAKEETPLPKVCLVHTT